DVTAQRFGDLQIPRDAGPEVHLDVALRCQDVITRNTLTPGAVKGPRVLHARESPVSGWPTADRVSRPRLEGLQISAQAEQVAGDGDALGVVGGLVALRV